MAPTENNFDPMAVGESRTFIIDSNKPKCKMKENEITIKKTLLKSSSNNRKFNVEVYNAFINCFPGEINFLWTKGITEGCGIGKILMRLCLNEENIHDVDEELDENLAMAHIRKLAMPGHELLEKWATVDCSKIVYLGMSPDPIDSAYVYFISARESGFDQMVITIDKVGIYPKSGPCSVETLQKRYDNGNMVEGDDIVQVIDQDWFFCVPRKKLQQPHCSNLPKSSTISF